MKEINDNDWMEATKVISSRIVADSRYRARHKATRTKVTAQRRRILEQGREDVPGSCVYINLENPVVDYDSLFRHSPDVGGAVAAIESVLAQVTEPSFVYIEGRIEDPLVVTGEASPESNMWFSWPASIEGVAGLPIDNEYRRRLEVALGKHKVFIPHMEMISMGRPGALDIVSYSPSVHVSEKFESPDLLLDHIREFRWDQMWYVKDVTIVEGWQLPHMFNSKGATCFPNVETIRILALADRKWPTRTPDLKFPSEVKVIKVEGDEVEDCTSSLAKVLMGIHTGSGLKLFTASVEVDPMNHDKFDKIESTCSEQMPNCSFKVRERSH